MCEAFARQRLTKCPPDIAQRLANGLGLTLSVLKNPCGGSYFPFQKLLGSNNPTAELPVLFSSSSFKSPELKALAVPKNTPVERVVEYWYGAGPEKSDDFCSRSTAFSYAYESNVWKVQPMFKSVPGVCLYSGAGGASVMVKSGGETKALSNRRPEALQLSGDGQKYFMKDLVGWLRHVDGTAWQYVSQTGAGWDLSASFDGTCFILSDPRLRTAWYFIGTQSGKAVSLPIENPGDHSVFAGVVGRLFFIVRGRDVFTVGSVNKLEKLHELDNGTHATGLWVDATTVWIATNRGTVMSNDAGCTWVEQKEKFAVGPGLYTTKDSNTLFQNTDLPFTQTVEFPLRLNDGGRLYNSTWSTWFEDKSMAGESAEVERGAPATLSPNGLYLVTQEEGVVTLYLNVWNFPTFPAWCKLEKKECKPAYAKYCDLYRDIDVGCETDTPGRPVKGDGAGMSTLTKLLIGLGSLAGLVLVVGLIYYLTQRSKRRAKVRLLTPPTSSVASSVASSVTSSVASSVPTSSIALPTSSTSSTSKALESLTL